MRILRSARHFISIPLVGLLLLQGHGIAQEYVIAADAPAENYRPLAEATLISANLFHSRTSDRLTTPQEFMRLNAEAVHRVHVVTESSEKSDIMPLTDRSERAKRTSAEGFDTSNPLPTLNSGSIPVPLAPAVDINSPWVSLLVEPIRAAAQLMGWGEWLQPIGNDVHPYAVPREHRRRTFRTLHWYPNAANPVYWVMPQIVRLVPSYTYENASGVRVPFFDAYADPANRFTPQDYIHLKNYLDLFPTDHLRVLPGIANLPSPEIYDGHRAFAFWELGAGIDGPDTIWDEVLGHEIGHFVLFKMPADARAEFESIWKRMKNPAYDTVHGLSYYPAHPYTDYMKDAFPYGASNIDEYFATVYGDWVANSAVPPDSANLNRSILDEAITRAGEGHPLLLEQVLFTAALFTDPARREIAFYRHTNPGSNWGYPVMRINRSVSRTATALTIGDYVFTIANGKITGVRTPYIQTAFSQSIGIPLLAQKLWS